MSAGNPRVPITLSGDNEATAKFVRLAQLRRLRRCEQVAAVCYRVHGEAIEFLLVETRGGRWTFPKGSAEPGLTHAQAAALEAYEEAGVHGRMEEASFTRYNAPRNGGRNSSQGGGKKMMVNAHLCEVLRLEPPPEFDRNPSWFSPDKAKRRLRNGRDGDWGMQMARVVDRAVTRIRRLHFPPRPTLSMQNLCFIDRAARAGASPGGKDWRAGKSQVDMP